MSRYKKQIGRIFFFLIRPFIVAYERYGVHRRLSEIIPQQDYHVEGPLRICGSRFISIGRNFSAGLFFRIEALDSYFDELFSPSITIGDNVSFQDYCHVGCVERIVIGDGTLIGSNVLISDHNHGYSIPEESEIIPVMRKLSHAPVLIGKHVWIGDGAKILSGVKLGDGVIVGANAVVTHSFPDRVVIAGVPARVIKNLDLNI